jgi:hypothetical protein
MKVKFAAIALMLGVSGCAYVDGARDIDPQLGASVLGNVEAQAVKPAEAEETTTDGARAALAVSRYRNNTSARPVSTRTSQVAGGESSAPR